MVPPALDDAPDEQVGEIVLRTAEYTDDGVPLDGQDAELIRLSADPGVRTEFPTTLEPRAAPAGVDTLLARRSAVNGRFSTDCVSICRKTEFGFFQPLTLAIGVSNA